MNIEKIDIKKVKTNPNNPRTIKDAKFNKLVESIKTFPEMLQIRPIVVDKNGVVLGGNMRLKACKQAGLTEVYIIKADALTEEQKKEFIIKDNINFGDWNYNDLSINWDDDKLVEWGLLDDDDEIEELYENVKEGDNIEDILEDRTVKILNKRMQDRMGVIRDDNYYMNIYFISQQQKEEFLEKSGWDKIGDKFYLSGLELAKAMGIELETHKDMTLPKPEFIKNI